LADLQARLAGVDVIATSVATGVGIEAVAGWLRPDRTAVLLGPSGAGKSSLANILLGTGRLATGAVRGADHRGRHTTSSRQLVAIPGGGVLIDTPGLRSLALGEGVGGAIEQVFPEIDELAGACRFADCSHEVEPGCAVVGAVAAGGLDPARLASYHKLQKETAAAARRVDPLLRKAELSVWKARTRSVRAQNRRKPR
jgi:ribosome biogenesis GTPase